MKTTINPIIENCLGCFVNPYTWYISEDNLNELKDTKDLRVTLILSFDNFIKSDVIVDLNGKQIKEYTKEYNDLLNTITKVIEYTKNNKESFPIKLDVEAYNQPRYIEYLCHTLLGNLYSGGYGKIPLDFKLAKKEFLLADSLLNETWLIDHFDEEVFKERYTLKLREQILNETELDRLRKSVKKSGFISSEPTDPDLRKEKAMSQKK